jgi:acetyltransferase
VLILKAGRSEEGARAVSSHTGSLAGSYTAYQAAFEQSGVIEVESVTDLLNTAMALDWLKLPKGRRAAIITNAGGPAALASDNLAKYGIQLARIGMETQEKLREKLNPAAQVSNPIDMLGGATEMEYGHALDCVLADEEVDMVLAILVPQALVDPQKVAQAFVDSAGKSDKPVLACMMGAYSVKEARELLHSNHLPMVDYPEQTGAALGALLKYADTRQTSVSKAISAWLKINRKLRALLMLRQSNHGGNILRARSWRPMASPWCPARWRMAFRMHGWQRKVWLSGRGQSCLPGCAA